jgi:hypothetical protein
MAEALSRLIPNADGRLILVIRHRQAEIILIAAMVLVRSASECGRCNPPTLQLTALKPNSLQFAGAELNRRQLIISDKR